jgi:Transposase DDE domain
MPRHRPLYSWTEDVVTHFSGHLSRPQATVLALYSFGMILAQTCGLTSIVLVLAPLLGLGVLTVKSRLQEFYQPQQVKSGAHRRELDVRTCFVPLLDWVLKDWPSHRLALALDATSLADRLAVLSISIVYRGCSLPIAWKVLRANVEHPWNPEWLGLLSQFQHRLPAHWTVLVMTDRGLYSRGLFQAIKDLHWHPLMRVTGGKFRTGRSKRAKSFSEFVARPGTRWQGRGVAFPRKADRRLGCTLLACWEEGQDEPWFLLTDLAAAQAEPLWYGMRAWIEQGFKLFKSAGWQWHRSRMTDPARAERLWLVIAVATRYVLAVGGEVEEGRILVETIPELPPIAAKSAGTVRLGPDGVRQPQRLNRIRQRPAEQPRRPGQAARTEATERPRAIRPSGTQRRDSSIFQQGLAVLVALLVNGQTLPEPSWRPEQWLELRAPSKAVKAPPAAQVAKNPSL